MDIKEIRHICRKFTLKVVSIGNVRCGHVAKMNVNQAIFMCKMASKIKENGTILEIGRHRGGSLALMSLVSKDRVKVFSIDKKNHKLVEPLLDKYKVSHKSKIIVADSHEYKWPKDVYIDLLFIDGDHSYKGCLSDLKRYSPYVKKGGFILMHDYPAGKSKSSSIIYKYKNVSDFFKDKVKGTRDAKRAAKRFIKKRQKYYKPIRAINGMLLIKKVV